MNIVETEADAAIAWELENVHSDQGKQQESVKIGGVPVFGDLSFDKQTLDLIDGGWNQDIKGVFYTLKSYFPNGFPKPMDSRLECFVGGHYRNYEIKEINGDLTNDAQLAIGLGAYTNRKS